MVKELKLSKDGVLSESHWMTPSSRLAAREKLQHLESLIGYPKHLLSLSAVNHEYQDIQVNEESLVMNRRSYR